MNEEYYLDINKIRIKIYDSSKVREYESNLALIFLHGSPGQISNWKYLINYFQNYYKTIAYDQRGYGDSDKPMRVSLEDYINDLKGVLDKLNLKNNDTVLIGHSFGGMVAQEYASRYKIRGLILIGSLVKYNPDIIDKIIWNLPPILWRRILFTENIITRRFYRSLFFAKNTPKEIYKEFLKDNKDYLETLPYYAFRYLKYFKDYDATERLKEIDSPTLIIVGEEDKVTPPSEAYKLNKLINNSTIKVVKNAGHMILYEKPFEISKLINNFINRIY